MGILKWIIYGSLIMAAFNILNSFNSAQGTVLDSTQVGQAFSMLVVALPLGALYLIIVGVRKLYHSIRSRTRAS